MTTAENPYYPFFEPPKIYPYHKLEFLEFRAHLWVDEMVDPSLSASTLIDVRTPHTVLVKFMELARCQFSNAGFKCRCQKCYTRRQDINEHLYAEEDR